MDKPKLAPYLQEILNEARVEADKILNRFYDEPDFYNGLAREEEINPQLYRISNN